MDQFEDVLSIWQKNKMCEFKNQYMN